MSAYCRFEILLPLEFNDGRPVPREFLAEAAVEVQRRFGGVSWESQVVEGIWRQGEVEYRDRLNRLFVDAEDTEENRQFFIGLKARLKSRFQHVLPRGAISAGNLLGGLWVPSVVPDADLHLTGERCNCARDR